MTKETEKAIKSAEGCSDALVTFHGEKYVAYAMKGHLFDIEVVIANIEAAIYDYITPSPKTKAEIEH